MDPSSLDSDALLAFDIPDDMKDFVIESVRSGYVAPGEAEGFLEGCLLAESQNFHALIECATSLHRSHPIDPNNLDGNDVLQYVSRILQGTVLVHELDLWQETDRLIARAKELEREAACLRLSSESSPVPPKRHPRGLSKPSAVKRQRAAVASHYWSDEQAPSRVFAGETVTHSHSYPGESLHRFKPAADISTVDNHEPPDLESQGIQLMVKHGKENSTSTVIIGKSPSSRKKTSVSPYFASPPPTQKKPTPRRPPRGTVSCLPFPPLTSPSFGLVQEKFAHEPFWLLVAITFLIRTKGTAALPIFLALKEKFPTLEDIAEPSNDKEILEMIRHLGLAVKRLGVLQSYARLFMDKPPRARKVYRVRNYDRRDMDVSLVTSLGDFPAATDLGMIKLSVDDEEHAEAWEIGHMTQGKYAIDSWRIFCRDELLGRAEDWNGKGREPEFQPEWMRVMPDDKELRAYLRWMWMREGWEWDPASGERTPLREEMQNAVNSGRVEYDDTGGLRILEEAGSTD